MKRKTFPEEQFVVKVLESIPNVHARLSNSEEDCGFHKADVVANFDGKDYYFQVSRKPKSRKQINNLLKRGTIPIHVEDFYGKLECSRVYSELNFHLGI